MSYEENRLMNLKDGRLMLSVLDGKISEASLKNAPAINVTDTEQASVKTLSDGADGIPMGLVVAVEPAQDLHGYDYPWPGGGAANMIPDGTNTSNGYVNGQIILEDGTGATNADAYISEFFHVTAGESYAYSGKTAVVSPAVCFYDENKTFISGVKPNGANPKVMTAPEGAVYARASQYKPGYSNMMQFEAGTSKTDIVPYSNICPISGWTVAKLTRTGKNLCALPVVAVSQVSINVASCFFIKAGTYMMQFTNPKNCTSARMCIVMLDSAGNKLLDLAHKPHWAFSSTGNYWRNGNDADFPIGFPITIVEDCYVRFIIGVGNVGSSSTADGMLVQGNQYEAYEPYTGNTYPITFPSEAGTVYGGTLTVNKDGTGTLVVDTKTKAFDGTETIQSKGTYAVGAFAWVNNEIKQGKIYASHAKRYEKPSKWDSDGRPDWCIFDSGSGWFGFSFPFSTGNEVKAYMAEQYANGTPYQVVYHIAPSEYQLTAEQVKTLLGLNNLWADTGDILSVDYSADTKLYVDQVAEKLSASQRLMELIITTNRENEMKATKAYSQGNLMIVNGALYKATTSIANGATLTVDTNITATTVAEELAALA